MTGFFRQPALWYLLLVTATLSCTSSHGQQGRTAKPVRKEEILHFNQVWVWSYTVSGASGDEQGEIAVYYNDTTRNWLFNSESYRNGEMIDWVLAKPDGHYVISATDEHDGHNYTTQHISLTSAGLLPAWYQPGNKKKKFGDPALGFQYFEGMEHRVIYEKTTEQVTAWIGHTAAEMSSLYHFNKLDLEAKIPWWFDEQLPAGRIVLGEDHSFGEQKRSLVFRYISPTAYEIAVPSTIRHH